MEFEKLGAHCALKSCNQTDFLPFKCDTCNNVFCLAHRTYASHSCRMDHAAVNILPQCPLCQQYVKVASNEDANTIMNAHISRGCRGHVIVVDEKKKKERLCGVKDCYRGKKHTMVMCVKCGRKHCISHRHPEDHSCESLRANDKTAKKATSRAGLALLNRLREKKQEKKQQSRYNGKSASAMKRVQRTAVMMKAQGERSVGDAAKFYLEVYYPPEVKRDNKSKNQVINVYVNREWTVGRCIDSICKLLEIRNQNNTPSARKICLYGGALGEPLPFEIPMHLLQGQVNSGDFVILQYEQKT